MHIVETQVSFEAAHRLYDVNTYSSECRENIHGHSYKVKVKVSCDALNHAGMVIDFKLLKTIIASTIESKYDHSCILKSNDPLCKPIQENCKKVIIVNENPTAEYMAEIFFNQIQYALRDCKDVKVYSVSVQETENNIATYLRGE